jgi:hypothetical protein
MPLEIAGGAGSGAALGAVEPESGLGKFAVGMAGGITGAGAMGQVLKGINRAAVGLGKRNFVKQLERGTDFKDVGFGRLSQNKLDSLNGLRDLEGVVKLDNGKLSIPAPVVRHFHERRIAGNGYTPQQVADLLDKAIHGKNSVVSRAAYPQIQALVDTQSVPANVGYIGKHTDTGATIVKGGHKIENSRLGRYKDLAPQGEQKPSLRVDTFVSPENNIPQSLGFVNENFIKGLADKDKARVLKNAGMAGDDNILAEARALTDRITRLEAGAPDTALANAMLTPQMKAAKTEYGAYMARNGDLPVDSKFIRQWRKENKTAKRFIDNYYRTHPKGFAGIPDGTLQELEEVKQILKNGANRLGEDTAKKGAFDAARNQIKDYMENQVAGFRPMNARYADAKMTQRMFEDAVKRGASQVGRSTVSQFKDQLIMTLGGGGALGGALTANPVTLASGLSALGLRELIRAGRRRAGRQIMENGARTTLADMLLNGAKAIPAGVPSTTLVKMLQEKLRAD